ncbi:MAG: site-specific integrase [Thermoplasmata archaeon]
MTEKKGRTKEYAALLENSDVRRWHENTARGSIITADVYLRRLGNFCRGYKTTPQKLVKLDDKKRYNLFMDFIGDMEKKKRAGSYTHSTIKALKSWLAFSGIVMTRKIKIADADDSPTLKNERIPTQPELKKVFLSANLQGRIASVLMAHSGLRPQSLGSYSGDDGLRISDFPDLSIEGDKAVFQKMPAMLHVRREISKAGHQYFTFLSEEGCEYLKDYLEERMREGEKLTPESSIVSPKVRTKQFIATTNIGDMVRKGLRNAGFEWRPYVLRSYFDTQLMLAESKGLVLRDYRTFWMGHKGDIENRYTTNKGKLSPAVIDDMREAYKKSQEFLQTKEYAAPKVKEITDIFRKQLLKAIGYSDKDIEKMKLDEISEETFNESIRERLSVSKDKGDNLKSQQKVVAMNEINNYLNSGWQYVTTLPNERVIIQIPSQNL